MRGFCHFTNWVIYFIIYVKSISKFSKQNDIQFQFYILPLSLSVFLGFIESVITKNISLAKGEKKKLLSIFHSFFLERLCIILKRRKYCQQAFEKKRQKKLGQMISLLEKKKNIIVNFFLKISIYSSRLFRNKEKKWTNFLKLLSKYNIEEKEKYYCQFSLNCFQNIIEEKEKYC